MVESTTPTPSLINQHSPISNTLAPTGQNSDHLVAFLKHWSNFRPKDKRARWGYLYIGFHQGRKGDQWKIGVSRHPWKRRHEIGFGESKVEIIFSRFVYRPYFLERGLHRHFREYGIDDLEWREQYGDKVYLESHYKYGSDEWFFLPPKELAEAKRIIDFWQLVSPVDLKQGPPVSIILQQHGPLVPIWEYESLSGEYAWVEAA